MALQDDLHHQVDRFVATLTALILQRIEGALQRTSAAAPRRRGRPPKNEAPVNAPRRRGRPPRGETRSPISEEERKIKQNEWQRGYRERKREEAHATSRTARTKPGVQNGQRRRGRPPKASVKSVAPATAPTPDFGAAGM